MRKGSIIQGQSSYSLTCFLVKKLVACFIAIGTHVVTIHEATLFVSFLNHDRNTGNTFNHSFNDGLQQLVASNLVSSVIVDFVICVSRVIEKMWLLFHFSHEEISSTYQNAGRCSSVSNQWCMVLVTSMSLFICSVFQFFTRKMFLNYKSHPPGKHRDDGLDTEIPSFVFVP